MPTSIDRQELQRLLAEREAQLVEVADAEAAERFRFLGSPSVRVDGRDVEPGAEERSDFVLSCRVYRSERGLVGQPKAVWIRHALSAATA